MRLRQSLLAMRLEAALVVLFVVSCSQNPVTTPPIDYVIVDDFPTWSPDGSTIAFQRRPPSQYGPSGLYLVPASGGGVPVLLTGKAYNFLSYTTSGTQLLATGSRGLVVISTDTGAEMLLAYTDNGIADPHMSSDGQWVAYSRILLRLGEPAESSGVHLVNVATGAETPLLDNTGDTVMGGWPRWAPGAPLLAYSTSSTLCVIDLPTRNISVLANARPGYFFAHPRWVQSGAAIMCSEIGPNNRTIVINVTTHQITQWPVFVGDFSAIAPEDSAFVYRAPQSQASATQYLVLYVRDLSDATGSSIRQLTHFSEPMNGSVGAR